MTDKMKIITLCGSTRFAKDFLLIWKELNAKYYNTIVLLPDLYLSASERLAAQSDPELMNSLIEKHRIRIDMADEVLVINKDGYIGETTKNEINYAMAKGIPIYYMEEKYYEC